MDVYLEQDIDREEYRARKAKFMSEKKTLEEKIITLEQKQNDWLEPFREWINTAQNAPKIARDEALFPKKVLAKEIFGSNLQLAEKVARVGVPQSSKKPQNPLKLPHKPNGRPSLPPYNRLQKFQKVRCWWRETESNRRPRGYESLALTN